MLTLDNRLQKKLFLTLGILVILALIAITLKSTFFKSHISTEKSLHAFFYEASKRITQDEKQREIFTECLVEKFKIRYGDQFEQVNVYDPKNINEVDVEACADQITKLSWTPLVEEKMLRKFSSLEELNGFTAQQKMDYAMCLLSKLKAKYPNGFDGPVPKKEMDSFYMSCVEVLKIKRETK